MSSTHVFLFCFVLMLFVFVFSRFSSCNRWFHFFNDDPANWIPAGEGVCVSLLIAVSDAEIN